MKYSIGILIILIFSTLLIAKPSKKKPAKALRSLHNFEFKTIDGKKTSFKNYKGKVLLIVNTASKCGFTPQYEGLETLYKRYQKQGLEIIAFPCNQFGNQDPGSNKQIQAFCKLNYKTSFTLAEKIDVKGKKQHPVYTWLTSATENPHTKGNIKWNFTKFLIDKNGRVVKRFGSMAKPLSKPMISAIEAELKAQARK